MERGTHRHYTHTRITEVIEEVKEKWSQLKREIDRIADIA